MIETKTKTIGGATYACTQFTARRGIQIQQRLLRLLAPVLGEGVGAIKGKSGGFLEADVDFDALGAAFRELVLGIATELDVPFILELLSGTTRNNQQITEGVFDLEFAGRYHELGQLLLFVLETNFGSFIGGVDWRGLGARFQAMSAPGRTPSSESSIPH